MRNNKRETGVNKGVKMEEQLTQFCESRIADYAILFYLGKKLVKPVRDWDAYKLGLVDQDGQKIRDPETKEEKNALTLMDKVILRLKYMVGHQQLRLLSSYILLRADTKDGLEDTDLELLSESERRNQRRKKKKIKELFQDFKYEIKELGVSENEFWALLLKNEISEVVDTKDVYVPDIRKGDLIRLTKATDGEIQYPRNSLMKVLDDEYDIIDNEVYIVAVGKRDDLGPVVLTPDMYHLV